MIPIKLVETIFHRSWALLIPTMLIPLIALGLAARTSQYQSTAVVWVTKPLGNETPAIGSNNPYLTPAQNQAQALNDLLSTKAFRGQVALSAGIVPLSANESELRRGAAHVRVSVFASGVNLLTINALAVSGDEAQAIVQGVIDQYLVRATSEIQRSADATTLYYTQQLTLAKQTLEQRSADLSAYLRSNPKAADPTNAASQDLTYRTILEQVDTQSKLVASLQDALQGTELRKASAPESQTSLFSVQDAPTLPAAPLPMSLTSRFGLPAAGLMLGLMIGLAYIYVAYRTDHTIRSAEDLAGVSVPLLGSIPTLSPTPPWARFTPISLVLRWRRRDFARKTAASIATNQPLATGAASEVH